MSDYLVRQVVDKMLECGIRDICICPGGQNSAFVSVIKAIPAINAYYWYEERSAAFFALGKSRSSGRPAAVITTSGTAVAELLPAAIEAYYTASPLLLVTADRPRRFRGTGAPQSIEQEGLFEPYTSWSQDIEFEEVCDLELWDKKRPGHINVCVEEPVRINSGKFHTSHVSDNKHVQVVVGGLRTDEKEKIVQFLLQLGAPIYPEALSGLREEPRLKHLITPYINNIWEMAEHASYPITEILRIGSVPTARLWRDLECKKRNVNVISYSELPFTGLSRESRMLSDLDTWQAQEASPEAWIALSQHCWEKMVDTCTEYPNAEPSMINQLSKLIPNDAFVYLGNSLPIREWDMAASREEKGWTIGANRGANGIDGQLSTFFGMCRHGRQNWVILGDLTTLYDMAAPWILNHLKGMDVTIVVINNYGGRIFKRMFSDIEIQNCHEIQFEKFAQFWGIPFMQWSHVPADDDYQGIRLIELLPDPQQTHLFWKSLDENLCPSRLPRETVRLELSSL